jgi:hypothetical protein
MGEIEALFAHAMVADNELRECVPSGSLNDRTMASGFITKKSSERERERSMSVAPAERAVPESVCVTWMRRICSRS